MSQQENNASNTIEKQHETLFTHIATSEKVTNHLANQRSFLAWVRTSLATITFGFAVETFGLNLGEWRIKVGLNGTLSTRYSAFFSRLADDPWCRYDGTVPIACRGKTRSMKHRHGMLDDGCDILFHLIMILATIAAFVIGCSFRVAALGFMWD